MPHFSEEDIKNLSVVQNKEVPALDIKYSYYKEILIIKNVNT